jgi:hypothetical protein
LIYCRVQILVCLVFQFLRKFREFIVHGNGLELNCFHSSSRQISIQTLGNFGIFPFHFKKLTKFWKIIGLLIA